jgi:multidrug resistance protein, MATE family
MAFPLVISAGSLSLMHVVDRAFLTMWSVDALAASMPAMMIFWTVVSLPMGIVGYTNTFFAQYEGAERKDRVAASLWQGLAVAVASGLLLLPIIVLSPWIFASLGHAPAVRQLEVEYFALASLGGGPLLVATVLSSFFTARQRASVVMWVNLTTSILNGLLDWILIFGLGPIPAMGIRGAALATVLAQVANCLLFTWQFRREPGIREYRFRDHLGIDRDLIRRMLRYGFPHGLQMLLDVGAFTAFVVLVGRLGTREQAATNLAFTLNSLAFVPILGMGMAVMTLVGRRIGEGRPDLAVRTVWKAFALSGGYMLAFAAIYLGLPDLILSPFIHGEQTLEFEAIRPLVITLLKFVALYTFFDAMAIVFGAAVRGAGDTRFSLIFTVVAAWTLMVLPTVWILRYDGGLYACWAACTGFVLALGIGFLLRFQQGRWKRMRVIE